MLLEFFWLALQLLSPVLRARAVPSVLYSGKTHCEGCLQPTGGLFFIERATVCHAAGATTRTDKEQPSSAIIATLASVYVQPPCNSGRHRTAHCWCATATGGTVSRLAGARKNTSVLAVPASSPANPPLQQEQVPAPCRSGRAREEAGTATQGGKGWHNVRQSPLPEPP
ncbi:hypothetical protein PRJ_4884 [Pseudomonas sp. XWY-1]|nr:hypothetical protein PRJ_4884 [Pseudomonas sp. XWY-1]